MNNKKKTQNAFYYVKVKINCRILIAKFRNFITMRIIRQFLFSFYKDGRKTYGLLQQGHNFDCEFSDEILMKRVAFYF